MTSFSEIVDAADNLSVDEQETLIDILRRRIAEKHREAIVQGVAVARAEFEKRPALSASVREIMNEVRGES
ncbi:MAG: hypothetical protein R3C19_03725 [Planctomycetaceae bacterium]